MACPTSRRAAAVTALVILAGAPAAWAEEPAPEPAPDPDVLAASEAYFAGERAQATAWTATGVVTATVGAVALASDDATARGAAYPLIAVGAIQLAAGVVSYLSPPRRLRRARAAIARDPAAYRAAERARITKVTRAFTALRVAEVSLLAVGAGLVIAGERTERDTLIGIGGGLAFQALAMLALDAAAEDRAHRYLERLSVTVGAEGAGVAYATPF